MKRKKKKINNTVDFIIMLVYLIISCYFVIEMMVGKIIPTMYIILIATVLLLILIGTFFTYRIRSQAFRVFRKVYLSLFCVLLLAGSLFQGQLRSAFDKVGNTTTQRMYVVTLDVESLKDLNDVVSIGYLNHADELTLYALDQIQNKGMKQIGYASFDEELFALNEKDVDAIMVSAQQYSIAQQKDETALDHTKILHTFELTVKNSTSENNVDLATQPFVLFVSGIQDDRELLSDVNMLLMVDAERHHVEMISVNRDTYVPNENYQDYPDKLTHLGWSGTECVARVMEKIFGIEVDYYAQVTFQSLIAIIDAMGGIDVDVKISFTEQDENRSFAEEDLIHLDAGFQHINGKQALAYARHRKTDGWDVAGREQAQRDIVAAAVKRMLSVDGAMKVGDVMNTAAQYVQTNLPMDSIKGFLNKAIQDGASWSFGSSTINSPYELMLPLAMVDGGYGYAVLLQEEDIQRVHDLYLSLKKETHLNDFQFDLNDMSQYMNTFQLDPHVITVENYDQVVPLYFPEYYLEGILY